MRGDESGGSEGDCVKGQESVGSEGDHVSGGESGVRETTEPDTPSKKSYVETDSKSEKYASMSSDSEDKISDLDERHDFVGFEETESLPSSDEETFTEDEEEEVKRGGRCEQGHVGRGGVYGGSRRVRRNGLGRAK